MKKYLLALALPALLLAGCQGLQTTDNASSDTITIGGIEPLSGDGAAYGEMVRNITTMQLDKINSEGGINGKKLNIVWEDGKCNPNDSSKAAQKLVNIDKVKIIWGGGCSGETLGAAPITEPAKVILFSPLSSSPEVTTAGDFVFRSVASDSSQGMELTKYANAHFQKIGILAEQTDYAKALADTFEKNFTGEVVREDYMQDESDFKTRITKLKNSDVEALFLVPQLEARYALLLKQLDEQNWNKPLIIDEVAEGSNDTNTQYKDFLLKNEAIGASFIAPDNKLFNDLKNEYIAKYGEAPKYENYAATTYDGLVILKKVLSEVSDPNNSEEVRDALYTVKNLQDTIFSNLSIDQNGDVNITYSLLKFDGEKFVPIATEDTTMKPDTSTDTPKMEEENAESQTAENQE